MSTIRIYHNRAMELAEMALVARLKGQLNDSINLSRQALENELAAIKEAETTGRMEPTYSVLQRSAATLALDCNENRSAERIVAMALAQDPPPEIAEELRDLLERINFSRHLQTKGISLAEDEIQMSLSGKGVGFGLVKSEEFMNRVDNTSKAICRIVERRSSKPFRDKGRPRDDIKENYELYMSVPRAASFAVTLKLGKPSSQQKLQGILDTSTVVDEFLNLMELANNNRMEAIREIIPDPAYFRNFVALAKKVAPDGETVRQVGFTAVRSGKQRFVQITRPAPEFRLPPADDESLKAEIVIVKGVLKFADATHGDSGLIKIVDIEGTAVTHTIRVPEGMMADIVRPMWDSVVTVKGRVRGREIILEDIQEE